MALDLLPENSSISPRISFSRDFCHSDVIPIEKRPLRSPSKSTSHNSSIEFHFSIPGGVNSGESFDKDSWSADELFHDGKILPTDIKRRSESKNPYTDQKEQPKDERTETKSKTNQIRDIKVIVTKDEDEEEEEKTNTKSFWGFKRSSSLNCGSGYGRSLCPLPLLRSNSTGSNSAVNGGNKQKQNSRKQTELMNTSKSSAFQKPPVKKSYGGYGNGGGIRVNPVLNVVPSRNLFGLGSIFNGSGREKKKR